MTYMLVQQNVTDYKHWRQIFESGESLRRSFGATGVKQVFQDVKEPKTVTVLLEWKDDEGARKFTEDPRLAELMKEAGVIGEPKIRSFLTQV